MQLSTSSRPARTLAARGTLGGQTVDPGAMLLTFSEATAGKRGVCVDDL
jgi:hypothetical protein